MAKLRLNWQKSHRNFLRFRTSGSASRSLYAGQNFAKMLSPGTVIPKQFRLRRTVSLLDQGKIDRGREMKREKFDEQPCNLTRVYICCPSIFLGNVYFFF